MNATTIYLVDDQDLFRMGLRMVLDSHDDITVIGEASGARDALAQIPRLRPDVVLMDIRMPGVDGLEATRQLMAAAAQRGEASPTVLVLTTLDTEDAARDALAAGAAGFMLKDTEPELLVGALRALTHGNQVVVTSAMPQVPQPAAVPREFDRLTERECDVFRAISHGLNNREIAATLYLSEATVKTHVGAILQKLGLRDRVQVVVYAYRHGLAA